MNKEELDALEKVIDYMWEDERKDYEESYETELNDEDSNINYNENHIFVSVLILNNYMTK